MRAVRHTVFSAGAGRPPIIVCSARVAHPDTRADTVDTVRVLALYRVGTLLHVASRDSVADAALRSMYAAMGVEYREMDLRDAEASEGDAVVPDALISDLSALYAAHEEAHGHTRAFMISCMSGINRSALCAALLLWHEHAAPRPWADARSLVIFMRTEQRAQRSDNVATLLNSTFVRYITDHCV